MRKRRQLQLIPATILHIFVGHIFAASPDEVTLLQAQTGHTGNRREMAGSLPEERLATLIREAQTPGSQVDSFRQPMINFGDAQYVSCMTLGKQMIAGIIDTGSFELVVFGSDCRSCSVAAHYNHHFSETYGMGTLRTQMNYGSGSTLCDESFEQVSIGPYGSKRQMFWEVVDAQMPILMNAAFEAIIGVGPTEAQLVQIWSDMGTYIKNLTGYYDRGMNAPPEAVSYTKQMVEAGVQLGTELPMLHSFKVPFFSICMGSEPRSDGVIVWNDTTAFDQPKLFVTVPVLSDHTWSALLTQPALRFEGRTPLRLGCEDGCTAIIDSGTSLLGAPSKVVKTVVDAMNTLDVNCSNLDVLPDLEFHLGGKHFSLPPSAIVAEVVGEVPEYLREKMPHLQSNRRRTCELMLMDMGDFMGADFWILGVPWFRKYYTTFELGSQVADRRFHVALHSDEDCSPIDSEAASVSMAKKRGHQRLQRIEAKRVHLPRLPAQSRNALIQSHRASDSVLREAIHD